MNKRIKRILKNYLLITLVSVLYGAGTSLFLSPNDLVPGGITGVAMILNRYIPLSVGSIFLTINIPIIAVAFYKFGFKFIISTFYTICCVSFFTDIFAGFEAVTKETLKPNNRWYSYTAFEYRGTLYYSEHYGKQYYEIIYNGLFDENKVPFTP